MWLSKGFPTLIADERLLSAVGSPVHRELFQSSEFFTAVFTLVWFVLRVYLQVTFVVAGLGELLPAQVAAVRFFSSVGSIVPGEVLRRLERFVTSIALVWPLVSVVVFVKQKQVFDPKCLSTLVALEWLLPSVNALMFLERFGPSERLITNIAAVQFLASVNRHVRFEMR